MGYCKQHDAYNGNGHCPHCSSEFNRDNSATIDKLIRERDEALAEVERLRETNEAIKRVTKEWRNDAERWRHADRKNDQLMAFARRYADMDVQITAVKAENKRLRKAITDCLDYANGRQYEWGSRAESAFEILENAIDAAREGE